MANPIGNRFFSVRANITPEQLVALGHNKSIMLQRNQLYEGGFTLFLPAKLVRRVYKMESDPNNKKKYVLVYVTRPQFNATLKVNAGTRPVELYKQQIKSNLKYRLGRGAVGGSFLPAGVHH